MRLSLFGAAALLLAVVSVVPKAQAFTVDDPSGNTSNGTPRFTDPDARDEKLADPSGSSSVFFGGRSSPADRYGYDPTFNAPLPRGAQIGGGEHGFDNFSRYRGR